jgi:hypothetical protein
MPRDLHIQDHQQQSKGNLVVDRRPFELNFDQSGRYFVKRFRSDPNKQNQNKRTTRQLKIAANTSGSQAQSSIPAYCSPPIGDYAGISCNEPSHGGSLGNWDCSVTDCWQETA